MNAIKINSYEDIRSNLRVRLMDIKGNAETLENVVYEPAGCGLALVAYMELDDITEGGIANVPWKLASEMEGTSPERVMEDAIKGSAESGHPKLCSIQDMLFSPMTGTAPENYLESGNMPEADLLVLTTEDGRLGASALYYPDMQNHIAKLVGGDYFVLPSSVHEVLIYPDRGTTTPKELAAMVKEINETQVAPQERLSNKVFCFRADTQELVVAADPDRHRDMAR